MQEEQPLQVARCTKIIQDEGDAEKSKYVINVKQIAKFVVNLGDRVSPTDIEEGMRVGYVIIAYSDRDEGESVILIETFYLASTETSTRSYFPYHPRSTLALP